MPVGKQSVIRAAKAVGEEAKKGSLKEPEKPEKKEEKGAVSKSEGAEEKEVKRSQSPRRSAGKKRENPAKKVERTGRVHKGELDGIMVIKSDLPVELL